MNNILKSIFLLPLILLFFPAFCVFISVKPIVIYYIFVVLAFAIFFFIAPKYSFHKLKELYKISAYKYYLLFALWCIMSGFILVMLGRYKLSIYIYYIISLLLIDYGLTYTLPYFTYNKIFNIKFFAKLLLTIYFLIFTIGILEFFGKTYNIEFLIFPSNFFGNQRLLEIVSEQAMYYDRVRSVFAEPGWLGGFIFFNMPILYSLTLSKYKVFQNTFLNIFLKKSLIPLMWVTIFIEQSAIWLVFNFLLTLYYFRKNIIRFLKKYFIIALIISFSFVLLCICIFYNGLNIDLGFYNRIIKFFSNIYSFDKLVTTDQSLGARLVSYTITVQIGIKNWLLGVGLGNVAYIFPSYYVAAKLPYVNELEINFLRVAETGKMLYNGAIPYQFFAEIGIIGVFLFYLFLYKTIQLFNEVKKYFINLEYDFLCGLSVAIFATAVILFYDVVEAYYYIWFLFGLTNIFIYKAYKIQQGKKK